VCSGDRIARLATGSRRAGDTATRRHDWGGDFKISKINEAEGMGFRILPDVVVWGGVEDDVVWRRLTANRVGKAACA
jgi:hypothetical protein